MTITREQAVKIAAMWDRMSPLDDPSVFMLALSTTGAVQSEGMRAKLLAYIDGECNERAAKMGFMPDYDPEHDLDRLRDYVAAVEIEAVEKGPRHITVKA